MSSINSISSNDYSSLFSNLSSSSSKESSSAFGGSTILGDYASIKNGSYSKLLKAYYKKQNTQESAEKTATANKAYSTVNSDAASLKKAADALDDNSLYAEGSYSVTDSKGEKTDSKYNYDAIYKKLSAFVDSYNELVKSGASEEASAANRTTLNLVRATSSNSGLLEDIGITTDKDGKMSIDRDKFNSANISTVRTLFQGGGSYGSTAANKASLIGSIASNKTSSNSSGSLYNSTGSTSGNNYLNNLYTGVV